MKETFRPVFLFAGICLFLLCLSEIHAESCDPLNCDPESWTWKTRVVYLSEYPDCPIEVGYRERVCNGQVVEIRISSYSFLPSDHPDCEAFDSDQQNPDGSPDWATVGQNFRDLFKQLSIDLFVELYEGFDPAVQELFHCGNGMTMQVSGVWGSCVEYEVCFNFPEPITFSISECSDTLCCLQQTTFCWDPEKGEPVVAESFTPVPNDCGEPTSTLVWPCYTWGCVPFCEFEGGKGSINTSPIEGQYGTTYNLQVAPNPVEAEATISYSLSEQIHVEIVLFDAFGRQVATVFSGRQSKGAHRVNLPAENLINGMYTFQVRANGESATGSVILSR